MKKEKAKLIGDRYKAEKMQMDTDVKCSKYLTEAEVIRNLYEQLGQRYNDIKKSYNSELIKNGQSESRLD